MPTTSPLPSGEVHTTGGKPAWRYDTVKVILENPAYCGDFAGGRWSYGKYHQLRSGRVEKSDGKRARRPEGEWIIHRDHHEAIIDRATFEDAQTKLARGKTGK